MQGSKRAIRTCAPRTGTMHPTAGVALPGIARATEGPSLEELRDALLEEYSLVASTARVDVHANTPQSSSAAEFGTLAITFRARQAVDDDEERTKALAALSCAV
jgi:hypothetical protein